MNRKIGLYLCQCGGEVSQRIDLDRIAGVFEGGDVEVNITPMLCTPEGLDQLSQEINQYDRVIFAGCTPKRIEKTLRDVARKAGLNPYLTHIVNLREQCAWVSDSDSGIDPTDKAISLINAALGRIREQVELEERSIDVNTDVAVIGAGICGVIAALNLSEDSRKVYLIERSPFLGGKTVAYEELSPELECAQCLLAEPLQDVLERDNIVLYTNSEVLEAKGGPGKFWLKVNRQPRFVDIDKCIGCYECVNACPVEIPNEWEWGMNNRKSIYLPPGALPNAPVIDRENCPENCQKCVEACIFEAIDLNEKEANVDIECGAVVLATGFSTYPDLNSSSISSNIYTSPQFERLLAGDGPTGGKILANGPEGNYEPESIAIIHCAGREDLGYCSRICCSTALKYSHMIHRQLPSCEIHHIYSDLVLSPHDQKLYDEAAEFANFHRYDEVGIRDQGGKIIVDYGEDNTLKVDMAIYMSGIAPPDGIDKFSERFNVEKDRLGFVNVEDLSMQASPGVMAAGGVLGPCSVKEAAQQGLAASGRILSTLRFGEKLQLNAESCFIDEQNCSGCRLCIGLCPYGAISFQNGVCKIDETFCRGCGICASTCPVGAINAKNYTTEQIYAEIKGLLK
ncbi:MAG: 4Fe-4S binding protein [Halobacteriota archaeon]